MVDEKSVMTAATSGSGNVNGKERKELEDGSNYGDREGRHTVPPCMAMVVAKQGG